MTLADKIHLVKRPQGEMDYLAVAEEDLKASIKKIEKIMLISNPRERLLKLKEEVGEELLK